MSETRLRELLADYTTASEPPLALTLDDVLRAAGAPDPSAPRQRSAARPTRSRMPWLAAAATLLVIAVTVGWALARGTVALEPAHPSGSSTPSMQVPTQTPLASTAAALGAPDLPLDAVLDRMKALATRALGPGATGFGRQTTLTPSGLPGGAYGEFASADGTRMLTVEIGPWQAKNCGSTKILYCRSYELDDDRSMLYRIDNSGGDSRTASRITATAALAERATGLGVTVIEAALTRPGAPAPTDRALLWLSQDEVVAIAADPGLRLRIALPGGTPTG